MYLIEILLPLHDNKGHAFESQTYERLRDALTKLYGGVTAFTRSPALGESRKDDRTVRDEIIVFEVMVDELNHEWWRRYRENLEGAFNQDEIVVRAIAMEKI